MLSDVLCAVCGGPTGDLKIAKQSRKAHLRDDPHGLRSADLDDKDFDGYDPEVVSKYELGWVKNCRLLGFNPHSAKIEK